jgi:hypothetical protein
MAGGDPWAAARAVDEQELLTTVGTALDGTSSPAPADPPAEEPPPAPNVLPGPMTSGLVGALMAKEEECKRLNAELEDRTGEAEDERRRGLAAAEAAYKTALDATEAAFLSTMGRINFEAVDLDRARAGIKAAIDALKVS